MKKINSNELEEFSWISPKAKFVGAGREISETLGWDPQSGDARARHSFAVEILRNTPVVTGDAFIFGPGEAHQLFNDCERDLLLYVVADDPIGESGYPDSQKWLIRSPERRLLRGDSLDYFDGEE